MKIEGFVNADDVDFSDEKAVLEAALTNEIRGRELYMQYAGTVKNELAKKVFVHLANEELVHIEDIRKFLESENYAGIDADSMTKADSLGDTKTFFGKLVSELSGQVSPSDDDNRSRDVAMQIEKDGYEYYKKGAEAAASEKLKKFLTWLMSQEQAHYMFIRNAFEYMNNPESWYAGEEGWLLEG